MVNVTTVWRIDRATVEPAANNRLDSIKDRNGQNRHGGHQRCGCRSFERSFDGHGPDDQANEHAARVAQKNACRRIIEHQKPRQGSRQSDGYQTEGRISCEPGHPGQRQADYHAEGGGQPVQAVQHVYGIH